jgi:hypothetical protein
MPIKLCQSIRAETDSSNYSRNLLDQTERRKFEILEEKRREEEEERNQVRKFPHLLNLCTWVEIFITTYRGTLFHAWFNFGYRGLKILCYLYELDIKLHTRLQNFISGYKTSYHGTKLHTRLQNFIPWYKTLYHGTKLHTRVQNFIPWYKTSYKGTKLAVRPRPLLPS